MLIKPAEFQEGGILYYENGDEEGIMRCASYREKVDEPLMFMNYLTLFGLFK